MTETSAQTPTPSSTMAGWSMAAITIALGAALVVLGLVITLLSDSSSVTSLIPAFVGVVFLALGLVARARPALNRHLMHGAAALALVAVVGSLGSAIGRGSTGWALVAQVGTIVLCGGFVFLAVQSFRAARRSLTSG